jgi:uncharacterized protein YdeI (YjbR/CyaY-like superfamily)
MTNQHFEQIYLPDTISWRRWLESNHDKLNGVWLIYYKKHSGEPRVPYNEAVEEALCFGWIDSTVKRIDEDRYMQKFTPRKPRSNWSESNKSRVSHLIKEGKMTPAGMKTIEVAKANGKWDEIVEAKKEFVFSDDVLALLESNSKAYKTYQNLAPSHKKRYLQWVMSAKKPETQLKRCREMIELLEKEEKLGMK